MKKNLVSVTVKREKPTQRTVTVAVSSPPRRQRTVTVAVQRERLERSRAASRLGSTKGPAKARGDSGHYAALVQARPSVTVQNSFHNSSVTLRPRDGWLSPAQVKRSAASLCPSRASGCTCGGALGERGHQTFEIVDAKADGSVKVHVRMRVALVVGENDMVIGDGATEAEARADARRTPEGREALRNARPVPYDSTLRSVELRGGIVTLFSR